MTVMPETSRSLPLNPDLTDGVLDDIWSERSRQDARWGEQNHPDGTHVGRKHYADSAREVADLAARNDGLTWRHILQEEVYEAFAESDPERLREELIQVAAVACGWVESIDRRGSQ